MADLIAFLFLAVLFPTAVVYIVGCDHLKPQKGGAR
jgi:nitrate reductase NapE component